MTIMDMICCFPTQSFFLFVPDIVVLMISRMATRFLIPPDNITMNQITRYEVGFSCSFTGNIRRTFSLPEEVWGI
ncbi:hypothetical protein Metfor_1780 [Methanoregula formicica SMSP]|uniref:Uncharacterized protein n=1 Tax=Methanoregula formicica (strain DSM 22288 / NBRC 105244 / SMSP) TaxID=593750 RepID=L0HHK5_METFS|nr:hypothetical protein Metfor_1780 [Methanoregula formicica SMSP]